MHPLVIGELVGTPFCWHLKRHVFLVTRKDFFYWYGTSRANADINTGSPEDASNRGLRLGSSLLVQSDATPPFGIICLLQEPNNDSCISHSIHWSIPLRLSSEVSTPRQMAIRDAHVPPFLSIAPLY